MCAAEGHKPIGKDQEQCDPDLKHSRKDKTVSLGKGSGIS